MLEVFQPLIAASRDEPKTWTYHWALPQDDHCLIKGLELLILFIQWSNRRFDDKHSLEQVHMKSKIFLNYIRYEPSFFANKCR
jgi:hypothetical protein